MKNVPTDPVIWSLTWEISWLFSLKNSQQKSGKVSLPVRWKLTKGLAAQWLNASFPSKKLAFESRNRHYLEVGDYRQQLKLHLLLALSEGQRPKKHLIEALTVSYWCADDSIWAWKPFKLSGLAQALYLEGLGFKPSLPLRRELYELVCWSFQT
jgi:hypothetical protein